MNRKLLALIFVLIVLTNCKERSFNNPVDPDNINMNLPAPSDLSIAIVDVNVLELTWIDNSVVEDGYRIERSIGSSAYTVIATLPANSTSWLDTTVSFDQTYTYRICAKHESYVSPSINSSFNYRLVAPSAVFVEQINDTQIRLNWQDTNHFEEGYKIDMKIGNAAWQVDFASVSTNSWTYINELSNTPQIRWRVRAYYKSLDGVYTNEVLFTPFTVADPIFSIESGTYSNTFQVDINSATEGCQIHFTTDGSEPNTNSTLYTTAIEINQNCTVKAIAYKSNWTASAVVSELYQFQVSAPIINIPSGSYTEEFITTISCETANAQIRYTTDGSEPSESSALYSSALDITQNTTLKAKAFKAGWLTSSTVTNNYTFTVADPIISLPTGDYYTDQKVKLSCSTQTAQIRYTTDGSEPNENSALYSSVLDIAQNTTLKAKAFKAGWTSSAIATATYGLIVSTPIISVPSGTYDVAFSTEISCSTPGAHIHYTTDGSEPLATSMLYTDPISIDNYTTLKAKAFKGGWSSSATQTAVFLWEFILVQGGTFTMGWTVGSDGNTDELPSHNISLNSFYIGSCEVTQSEWMDIMGSNPATGYGVGDNYPVYYVSWYDILKYCNLRSMAEGLTPAYSIFGSTDPVTWGNVPTSSNAMWNSAICNWSANGYRLPTEAEWEYAARGATNNPDYLYSGSDLITNVAWYSDNNTPIGSKPVGTKAPNGLGLYDMSGNVWEWCWDWYSNSYYSSSPSNNPAGPENGISRVRRGGVWYDYASFCRIAGRSTIAPYSSIIVGFRICRSVP